MAALLGTGGFHVYHPPSIASSVAEAMVEVAVEMRGATLNVARVCSNATVAALLLEHGRVLQWWGVLEAVTELAGLVVTLYARALTLEVPGAPSGHGAPGAAALDNGRAAEVGGREIVTDTTLIPGRISPSQCCRITYYIST
jgi:hypothetical protein